MQPFESGRVGGGAVWAGAGASLGTLKALEDRMCRFGTPEQAGSPDRIDALVLAPWALMVGGAGRE